MARLCVTLLLLLSSACGSSPITPTENPVPLTVTRLTIDPAPLALYSGLRNQAQLVIRDAATWQAQWTEIWDVQSAAPPIPVVDFTREMVILAAMGEQRTGGYSIAITAADETSSGVTVRISTILPGAGCGVTQALTQPVDAVKVPRRETGVSFAERRETVECR
jgi:hypothetical protein